MVELYTNVNFILLYIEEAHPEDGWYIGDSNIYCIKQHQNINERKNGMSIIKNQIHKNVNILLDNMNNDGKKYFGVQYERIYIVFDNKITYQGENGPFGYDLSDVELKLKELLQLK